MLGKTRPIYEFIRRGLGVEMHGLDNFAEFGIGKSHDATASAGVGGSDFGRTPTIGQNVSVILASLRNGDLYKVMHEVLRDVQASTTGEIKQKL